MSYDLGLCGTPMSGIYYFIAEQYWEVSVQATASGTTLCKTLLDCNGMEGSSSISSLGHWTMEAWVMNWVIWYIYEWCLLCHGGAVLRGGRKPICSPWRHLQVRVWCMPTASTGVSTSSGDVTAGGADPTALSRIEEYHSIKLRWLDNSNIMSTIPLIIRAPNPNNQGFLSDLLMLKRPPGPRVRDVPSSTRRLPKKSSSVFRLPAIVTPQRRRLLDGTVLSNRRNGYRDCKRTTKFGLL